MRKGSTHRLAVRQRVKRNLKSAFWMSVMLFYPVAVTLFFGTVINLAYVFIIPAMPILGWMVAILATICDIALLLLVLYSLVRRMAKVMRLAWQTR